MNTNESTKQLEVNTNEMSKFYMNLDDAEELLPIESPDSIIGPWFFVHKV